MEPGIRDYKEIWEQDSGLHLYGRDTGFSVNTKRDPGNCRFEAPRSGISDVENFKINSTFAVGDDGNDRKFPPR